MKKVLLDTNAYKKQLEGWKPLMNLLESDIKILVSPTVLGELFTGYKKGRREQENIQILERFFKESDTEYLKVTKYTAEVYAQIKCELEKIGKPIPTNDIWIAAQAMENGAVLVTYDQHFLEIPGLRIWGE